VSTEAVIIACSRTPIGRAHKGSLIAERPDDLLAQTLRDLLAKVPAFDSAEIDDVHVGCGFPEQRQGMNIARRSLLLAGLPASVPGTTVSRFCASSLQAIRMAFHAIRAGEGSCFIAAGVESITQVDGFPRLDEEFHPQLRGNGAISDVYVPMGITAENVAKRWGIERAEMDRFAQRSHERAAAAQREGFFNREIAPYRRADGVTIATDDGPRPDSSLERLAELKPAFVENGKVTAGNSCPLNDGAGAVLVMSDVRARELGLQPLARIVSSAVSAVEPEIMGVGPIGAVQGALRRAGMVIDVVDVFEINEAFAAQVLPVCGEVGIDPFDPRVNPHGGAIALGHPYGMTGVRIMGTMLNGLESLDRSIGLETMCVAGGQGMAMIVERLS
jgi:acetyl-CoA C-acetyltransferase